MFQPIRDWLRSDMKVLRWVLLGLYLLLLAWISVSAISMSPDTRLVGPTDVAIFLVTMAIFIVGGGTTHLCEPIRPRRLWIPVAVGSLNVALVILSAVAALAELCELDLQRLHSGGRLPYLPVLEVGSWPVCGALLWYIVRRRRRHSALAWLTGTMFLGGLMGLVVAIPAHLIVRRRWPFGGAGPMLGIAFGIYVMLFALGPMLALLFLQPRYRREMMERDSHCRACGYDLRGTLAAGVRSCPECGAEVPDNAVTLPLT
jgi:hypothetical protein